MTRVIRRGQRSRKTPTNGPRTENGRRIVAKPAAMAPALGARSGEKSTEDTSATWKTPSANWDSSRTENSRRKPP